MAAYGLQRIFGGIEKIRAVFTAAAAVFLFVPAAFCAPAGSSRENAGFSDKVIASTVKLMARTFVLTSDLEKLKRKHIAQIDAMDDETFSATYANTLGVIYESPQMRAKFGVPEDMGREDAVTFIRGLDKNKLCGMVDAVPDSVIAARFRRFMARRMEAMQGMDFTKRIHYAWNSLVGRLEK